MSQGATINDKNILIGLAVVVALLAVIIGVLIYEQQFTVPEPTLTGGGSLPSQPANPAGGSGGEVDLTKATKVPKGQSPEEFLKEYYEAIVKGDYASAYGKLPTYKKAEQTADQFAQTLKGYGVTGYEMDPTKTEGDQVTIEAFQKTPNGAFGTVWVFAKQGDSWVVKSKEMGSFR